MRMPTVDKEAGSSAQTELRRRIVERAGVRFLRHGYSAFAMSALAADLGVSKKTLYVHFASKDVIIRTVIDKFATSIRAEAESILAQAGPTFVEKLRSFAEHMITRLGRFPPAVLSDLQRMAPQLYRHLQRVRRGNIAHIFSRFIEAGHRAGVVRTGISSEFAGEFFVYAMQGMLGGETLQRMNLTTAGAFEGAIRIFFGGLLTPAGQKEYEKSFPH
jgi:AcrR family transcriptional regulator